MKYFITFGHQQHFIDAGKRLTEQAKQLNVFDHHAFYMENDLMRIPPFWDAHGEYVRTNRMYGFFIWKPYIVLDMLEKMNNGDVLWYADSGCEIDTETDEEGLARVKNEFLDFIALAIKDEKIIASYCNVEKKMCKMDLIAELGLQDNMDYMNSLQIQSTSFVLVKSPVVMTVIREWCRLSSNYHLLDDSPSIIPNFDGFDGHRHDQSIFSLLVKKYNLQSNVSLHETMCLSRNRSGTRRKTPLVVGSPLFCHLGYFNWNQVSFVGNEARKRQPRYILETGFFTGRSTATLLILCKEIKTYINCDSNYSLSNSGPGMLSFMKSLYPCMKSFEQRSQNLFQGDFLIKQFPNGIDWFTSDGDVTYEGLLSDLITVFPHMNTNGVIMVNHYMSGPPHDVVNQGVTNACDLFYFMFKKYLSRRVWNELGMGFCMFEIVQPYNDNCDKA